MKKIKMAILLLVMAALLTVSSVAETAYLGDISISYGAAGGWGSASAYTTASFSSHITAGVSGATFYREYKDANGITVGERVHPTEQYGSVNNASDNASYSVYVSGYYAYSVDTTHSYYYTVAGSWSDTSYFYDASWGY